jgi:hypothetical protein
MSATTETLLEEIARTEKELALCESQNDKFGAGNCRLALVTMRKNLVKAQEALNEGTTRLLKD